MPYLVDTNILLRLLQRQDPKHETVRTALRVLRQRGEGLYYASQNLVEFWCVCTRPVSANGFGLSIPETDRRARLIERLLTLLPDTPAIHTEWRSLVVTLGVSGVQVHDARLVAAMRVHGLSDVLTLNPSHFARYPGIRAVHPETIGRESS
ncbi:MAG: PIN domain-containing protein [Planctomycetes bacterium]|nr:PIN domain-containing protein [Planctomycetota bacterium]MBM4078634.1 PIN domain-containing protein [Planctomycetota bacterium]